MVCVTQSKYTISLNIANQSIEELDSWHVVHDNLDEVSGLDSESIHDTIVQPRGEFTMIRFFFDRFMSVFFLVQEFGFQCLSFNKK